MKELEFRLERVDLPEEELLCYSHTDEPESLRHCSGLLVYNPPVIVASLPFTQGAKRERAASLLTARGPDGSKVPGKRKGAVAFSAERKNTAKNGFEIEKVRSFSSFQGENPTDFSILCAFSIAVFGLCRTFVRRRARERRFCI